jgi:hypothetical protein
MDNMITFNDMPIEIQYMIINKMQGSDIVKLWYNFPNTRSIINSYLNNNNIESIDSYIMHNLDNYTDINTRNHLMKFPQRMSYILSFFELGYYYQADNYCTIDDEDNFNNFIKLMKFSPYLQDAFDLVIYNDKEIIKKYIQLSYNSNLSQSTIYKLSYQLNDDDINECINMCKSGHNENDILYHFWKNNRNQ